MQQITTDIVGKKVFYTIRKNGQLVHDSKTNQDNFIRFMREGPELQESLLMGFVHQRLLSTDPAEKYAPEVIQDFAKAMERIFFPGSDDLIRIKPESMASLKKFLMENEILQSLPVMENFYLRMRTVEAQDALDNASESEYPNSESDYASGEVIASGESCTSSEGEN